jgi:NitT/TauT family transport system permease protein
VTVQEQTQIPRNALGSSPSKAALMGRNAFRIVFPFAVLAALWQIGALVFPPYLFPSLPDVFLYDIKILSSWALLQDVLATSARIMAGLFGAFIVGAILALMMYRSRAVDQFLAPILSFFQGIPALSWVVFAIIWFHGTEPRIFFIMVLTTLPAFTLQILGALRAMPKDLFEMVLVLRPSRFKLFRIMIFPSILPDILTAWKVNLGNASRVVVVAELVGATGGVGYRLIETQQQFDMAGALAWTLQLVFFVLIIQQLLTRLELYALRYRPTSERSA